MKKGWLILAVLFPLFSSAQGKKSTTAVTTFSSVGLVTGESTAKPFFQLSSGITFDNWFAGAGAGYDQYMFNSFPLYADCRMNFGKDRTGFLYGNFGYNFSAKNNKNKKLEESFITGDRFSGGFYMDVGIGYRMRLGTFHKLLFSAGYSRKTLNERVYYRSLWCWPGPCEEQSYDFKYELGRIVARISWELGKTK